VLLQFCARAPRMPGPGGFHPQVVSEASVGLLCCTSGIVLSAVRAWRRQQNQSALWHCKRCWLCLPVCSMLQTLVRAGAASEWLKKALYYWCVHRHAPGSAICIICLHSLLVLNEPVTGSPNGRCFLRVTSKSCLHCMRNCYRLCMPMIVVPHVGRSWQFVHNLLLAVTGA
jgi:hypothetical protein